MISTAVRAGLSRQPNVISAGANVTSRSGRAVGSKCRFLTTKTPQKPPTPAPSAPKPPAPKPMDPIANEFQNPPDVTVEVTPEMKRNNVILATLLVGFVGGIAYYSMYRVGSQDSSSAGDDPLAQLKLEAQEALDQQEKDSVSEDRSVALLQEFTQGQHDPDKAELDALEELEQMEEDEKKKKKKSWWKFW